jgi:hypothetical protein
MCTRQVPPLPQLNGQVPTQGTLYVIAQMSSQPRHLLQKKRVQHVPQ